MTGSSRSWCQAATHYPTDSSSVAELLAHVLGASASSCQELCRAGGLHWLANQRSEDLSRFGLEEAAVNRLVAVLALCRAFQTETWTDGERFQSSAAVYAHFHKRLADADQEHLYVVLLDAQSRKLGEELAALGGANVVHVSPMQIFRPAIRLGAVSVLLVHNHPGDPTPSDDDVAMTRRLREAGELMGVRIVDHLIVGRTRYVSFGDHDYW